MNCEFKRFETMSPTVPVNFLINWAGGEDKFHMEKKTPFLLCSCSSKSDRTYTSVTSHTGQFKNKFLKTSEVLKRLFIIITTAKAVTGSSLNSRETQGTLSHVCMNKIAVKSHDNLLIFMLP